MIIEIDQPYSNHNGGALAFSPDGYLFIALGDGGGANDTGLPQPPLGFAQDTTTLLGKILRLEVTPGQSGYRIPADNPFVGSDAGRDEIWAWGFRNPFRMAFDTGEHAHLFVADVGQNRWEEISIVSHPGNYGWRAREGVEWFNPPPGSTDRMLIDPIVVYPNTNAFGNKTAPELRSRARTFTAAKRFRSCAENWCSRTGHCRAGVRQATFMSLRRRTGWEAAWQDAPATRWRVVAVGSSAHNRIFRAHHRT